MALLREAIACAERLNSTAAVKRSAGMNGQANAIPLFFTYDEIGANSFKSLWANSFYFAQIIYGSIGATGYNFFSKNRADFLDRLKFFLAGSV